MAPRVVQTHFPNIESLSHPNSLHSTTNSNSLCEFIASKTLSSINTNPMAMARAREGTTRLLISPLHRPDPDPSARDEEDFDFQESDVVWSSSSSTAEEVTSSATTSAAAAFASASSPLLFRHSPAAGISAALFSSDKPQSIQRKTTSSPISMISAPSSDGGPGPFLGPYYGRKSHQSAPMNVPIWPTKTGARRGSIGPSFAFDEEDDEGFEDDDGEMVPPHEIIARSHQRATFSVIEGAGRTLKGRDLTTLRNSVFQKTGFLD